MREKKTILIVDDEEDVLNYLKILFEDNGYATLTAADGIEAMEMVRTHNPDLITLDLAMPEQSGVRTYRDMKDDPELRRIPMVVITALGEDMHTFMKRRRQLPEPEGFMAKPIDQQKLLEMIEKLLSR